MFIEYLRTYLQTDEGMKLMRILERSEVGDFHLGLATQFREIIAETSPEDHNLREQQYIRLAFSIEETLPLTNIIERTIKPLIGEEHTSLLINIYKLNPNGLREIDTTTIQSLKMSIERSSESATPTPIEHISDSPCSLFSRESKEDEISEEEEEEESKDEPDIFYSELKSKYNGETLTQTKPRKTNL